jgi:hypothetical protein
LLSAPCLLLPAPCLLLPAPHPLLLPTLPPLVVIVVGRCRGRLWLRSVVGRHWSSLVDIAVGGRGRR